VLKEPLAPKLNFNHTLSLLQALSGAQNGGAGGADSSTSDNPAMQALRGQGSAVGRLAPSIGQSGQEATSGQRNFNGFLDQNFRSANAAATKSSNALPPRVSYSMVHQIADKMAWQVKNNVNRVHVQLNPPELGRVEVQMVMRNNQVQAQVVTEHAAVRGALEEHYAVLRDNLASRGLQLEKFDVYSGPQRELSWSHSEQRQGGGNGRRKNGGSSDRPDPDGQPASRPNLRRHYGQIDHVI
jgi:flagellar hook-length control protein FliK